MMFGWWTLLRAIYTYREDFKVLILGEALVLAPHLKIDNPYSTTILVWTPIFGWHAIW